MRRLFSFVFITLITFSLPTKAADAPASDDDILCFETINTKLSPMVCGLKITGTFHGTIDATILDKMRRNPLDVLVDCQKCALSFRDSCDMATYNNLVKYNPFFLQDECSISGCSFNRRADKARCPRTAAINCINTDVLTKLDNNIINVASYACGHNFFNLDLMLNLYDQGYTIDKFILIDPILLSVIRHANAITGSIKLTELVAIFDAQAWSPCQINSLKTDFLRLHQFLAVAHQLFGDVSLMIFAHSSHYAHASTNDVMEADICFALDHRIASRDAREYELDFHELATTKIGYCCSLIEFIAQAPSETRILKAFITSRTMSGDLKQTERLLLDIDAKI